MEGVLRCRERYEVERGRSGRGGDVVSTAKDWERVREGVTGLDEAGDRCEGGV